MDSFNNNCRDIGFRIVKNQYYMNWRKFNFTRGLFLDKCNIDQELSIQFDFIFGERRVYRCTDYIISWKKRKKGKGWISIYRRLSKLIRKIEKDT